jgi:hypothetical protein
MPLEDPAPVPYNQPMIEMPEFEIPELHDGGPSPVLEYNGRVCTSSEDEYGSVVTSYQSNTTVWIIQHLSGDDPLKTWAEMARTMILDKETRDREFSDIFGEGSLNSHKKRLLRAGGGGSRRGSKKNRRDMWSGDRPKKVAGDEANVTVKSSATVLRGWQKVPYSKGHSLLPHARVDARPCVHLLQH